MDDSSLFARRAATVLARGSMTDDGPSAETRGRAIAAMEAALRASRRKRRLQRVGLGLGCVAAAAALVLLIGRARRDGDALTVVAHPLASGVMLVSPAAETPLASSQPLPRGARVVAREGGRASLELSTGTRVGLEADADVTMIEDGTTERFYLAAGHVRADVAPLRRGQRFVVATADAEVEVHGTSFHVAVVPKEEACAGLRTRVEVVEGVVTVRAQGTERALGRGDRWPPSCAEPSVASALPEHAVAVSPTPPRIRSLAVAPRAPVAQPLSSATVPSATPNEPPDPPSSLPAQNDLFARAARARNGGHVAEAIALFEELLEKYPHGPLTESASVERMKALAHQDPRRGAAAARRYLESYPHGFARADASKLLEAAK